MTTAEERRPQVFIERYGRFHVYDEKWLLGFVDIREAWEQCRNANWMVEALRKIGVNPWLYCNANAASPDEIRAAVPWDEIIQPATPDVGRPGTALPHAPVSEEERT